MDVLYNNAGVNSSGSVMDATDEDWDRCFAVNAKGTFLCSRAAARPMACSNQASSGLPGVCLRTRSAMGAPGFQKP